MFNSLLHSATFLLVLHCFYPVQQAGLTGVWYFDRFGGPHGEVIKSGEGVKANQMNKGVVFTFTNDGKLIMSQPDAPKRGNSTMSYKVFDQGKLMLMGNDTMRVMLLTREILELYPKNESKPALFLKRSKDGKTSMSAP